MPIKFFQAPHTVSWLLSQNEDGKLLTDISIQRGDIWDNAKRSNFIVSILLGVPIESLLYEETKNDTFNVLDGKQRTLTLCKYLKDEFALSEKIQVKSLSDNVDLIGKRFSELPATLQKKLKEFEVPITVLRSLNQDERGTVFFMRNQGAPLTKMDLSLVQLGEKAVKTFNDLLAHPFITKRIKLTAPALNKHDDLRILLQYLILHTGTEKGFSGREILSLCEAIKSNEVAIPTQELKGLLDYLNDACENVERKYLKKIHVPVVMHVAQKASDKGITANDFGARLTSFFEKLTKDDPYMEACLSGSAKRANIQSRIQIMMEILEAPPAPLALV